MIGLLSELVDFKNLVEVEPDKVIVEFAKFKVDFFPWSKGDEVVTLQLIYKEEEEKTWLEEVDRSRVVQSRRVMLAPYVAPA